MLANFTFTHGVNQCLKDFIQDMILTQICEDSSPVRSNLEVSKNWSSRTFNEYYRTSHLREFYTTKNWKKIDFLIADWFCRPCNTLFGGMAAFHHYCSCLTDLLLVKKIFNVEEQEGNRWIPETVYRGCKLHSCRILEINKWKSIGLMCQ